jgi:hypothetical protein
MVLTESALRHVIREAILLEEVEKKIEMIDQKTDAVMDKSDALLDKTLDKLDDLLDQEEEGSAGDESVTIGAAIMGSIGLGLALPTIMKVIGKIAKVIGATIDAVEDFATFGKSKGERMDRYENWWKERGEAIHHKYEEWMNKASEKILSFVMDEPPSEKQIKILSGCLWGVLYCTIGIHAGMGAWHGFHSHSTLHQVYGGYEAIAAAVKEGEALMYIVDAIKLITSA